jgi:hypothetical protein
MKDDPAVFISGLGVDDRLHTSPTMANIYTLDF